MAGKKHVSTTEWTDPDEAPEVTEEMLDRGVWSKGNEPVEELVARVQKARGGRPRSETPKRQVTLRLDADLVETLRAQGRGWQTRVNEMLRRDIFGT